MLIPYRTDAPVYHRPWATMGLIALNLVIQIWATASDDASTEQLVMVYGEFAPWQWLTSVFAHAGWLHLIGNMVFLWVFGLVVEGKVGWWRFLAMYGVIAVASCAIEQTLMLGAEGYSLGASGVIFGLMMIALVWAPENEVDCLLLLLPLGARHLEMSMKLMAGIFLALQVLDAALNGWSSGALHLLGAACGLPVGLVMLKRRWVDCEGWDWFSRRNRHLAPAPAGGSAPGRTAVALRGPAGKPAPPPPPVAEDHAAIAREHRATFEELVQAGQAEPALQLWQANGGAGWGVAVAVRERLVGQLIKLGRVKDIKPLMDGILAEDPGHPAMGLLAAQLLIKDRRPAAARERLEAVAARLGDERQRAMHAHLSAKAAELEAQGVLEIDH